MRILTVSTVLALLIAITANADLIAHYDFSDGNLTDDESVNGHTLTEIGAGSITTNADGFSAAFDGVNYLASQTFNGAAGASNTVSLWFRPDSATPTGQSSVFSTTGDPDWQLEYLGKVRLLGDNDLLGDGEDQQVTAGVWHHMVIVDKGTTAAFYVSELGGLLNQSIGFQTFNNGMTDEFRIGVNRAGNLRWAGDYADVRIHDTALNDTELGALLEGGPLGTNEILLAKYDFSDGVLTDDETGHGYTLTQSPASGDGITLNSDGFSAHIDGANGATVATNHFTSPLGAIAGPAYTVSMWFKTTIVGPSPNCSICSSTGANDWQIEDSGNIRVLADATTLDSGTAALSSDTWYHFVMWTDGTDGKFYLTQEGGSLSTPVTATGAYEMDDLRIGINRAGNLTWEGDYATIGVYNYALTEEELTEILEFGANGRPPQGTLIAIQ